MNWIGCVCTSALLSDLSRDLVCAWILHPRKRGATVDGVFAVILQEEDGRGRGEGGDKGDDARYEYKQITDST